MPDFLYEFFYSALLWGSLVTWGLWRLRKHIHGGYSGMALWLVLVWFGWHTAVAWFDFVLPPGARLIAAESGQPLAAKRAVLTWHSYPIPIIWLNFCTGRQAHLTDGRGKVSFRFTPYPSLISGTFSRSLQMVVPGRVDESKESTLLMPIRGDMKTSRLEGGGGGYGHDSISCYRYRPQYYYHQNTRQPWARRAGLLPGEEDPFEITFREACIEQQDWTRNYWYIDKMMFHTPSLGGRRDQEPPMPLPEPLEQFLKEYGDKPCDRRYGTCERRISPARHAEFCAYFSDLRSAIRTAEGNTDSADAR